MPNVVIRGCSFHCGQAVWWKIQEVGLQEPYTKDNNTHKKLRKLLSLPYIPDDEIERQFLKFYRHAEGCHPLFALLDYIRDNWVYSDVWPPRTWCMFGRSVRTNNDVEGWHHRINYRARKGQLNFYLLVKLLYDEAQFVNLQVHLLSDGKVLRKQGIKYRKHHGQLVQKTSWTISELVGGI